jgi:hypothetical protein
MAALTGLVNASATIERGQAISTLFASLTPDQAQRLALLYPGLGNIDGVPFKYRYDANRVNVAAALKTRKDNQPNLDAAVAAAAARVEDSRKRNDEVLVNADPRTVANAPSIQLEQDLQRAQQDLATAKQAATTNLDLINNYGHYVHDVTPSYEAGPDAAPVKDRTGHQILVFSDEGPGAIAEVWGNVTTAQHIGVAIPGTGQNMTSFPNNSAVMAEKMIKTVDNRNGPGEPGSGMAMVAWAGGEFPQNVPIFSGEGLLPEQGAQDAKYAQELGARLYRCSEALNAEALTSDAGIVGGAHSYGGAVLGVALQLGMKVDGALFVEAAGLGPGITSTAEYPHEATTRIYQMTAPGDPIEISRKIPLLGGDPAEVPGIVSLETGFRDDAGRPGGELLSGEPAHNDVFTRGTTAQQNISRFYSGQPMEAKATEPKLTDPGYEPKMVDPNGFPDEKNDYGRYLRQPGLK